MLCQKPEHELIISSYSKGVVKLPILAKQTSMEKSCCGRDRRSVRHVESGLEPWLTVPKGYPSALVDKVGTAINYWLAAIGLHYFGGYLGEDSLVDIPFVGSQKGYPVPIAVPQSFVPCFIDPLIRLRQPEGYSGIVLQYRRHSIIHRASIDNDMLFRWIFLSCNTIQTPLENMARIIRRRNYAEPRLGRIPVWTSGLGKWRR
jgi:hypothetical protein